MNIINLSNRYNVKNRLEQSDDNPEKYYLIFDNEKEWDYCRVGYKTKEDYDNKNFEFIDPSGGPFISLGDKFAEGTVYKISEESIDDNFVYTIYIK